MTDVDKEAYWKTVPVRVDSSHRLVFDSLCRVILERKREGGGGRLKRGEVTAAAAAASIVGIFNLKDEMNLKKARGEKKK
jgi:hypothetical protein